MREVLKERWGRDHEGRPSSSSWTRMQTWGPLEGLLQGGVQVREVVNGHECALGAADGPAGKCRAIGVSNYTLAHLQHMLPLCSVAPMVNQVSCPRTPGPSNKGFIGKPAVACVVRGQRYGHRGNGQVDPCGGGGYYK